MNFFSFINHLPSGWRLGIAAAVGAVAAIFLRNADSASVHWMGVWLAFALTHLLLSWISLLTCDVHQAKKLAHSQDAGRATLSFFVLVATATSLIAIVLLYASAGEKSGSELMIHILMTLASVAAAWTIVHTTLAFKYAHLFYGHGGLDFPGDDDPEYMDFVYFSFVIGTTFQVSDIAISSSRIRRIAWLHGVLSFAFNTIIVALSINIISSLIQDK